MNLRQHKIALGIAGAVLAVSAWVSNSSLFRQVVHTDSHLTQNIPTQLGAWHLVNSGEASASEIRGLETRDIIKRSYMNESGSQVIELVVAYIAESSRKSAHAQEACLRGSGALVGSVNRQNMTKNPVRVTVISIDQGGRLSWVYYWYKIGDTYTSDYLKSSLMMFMGGLVGKKTHGASLVRLLTPSVKGESEVVVAERMEDFTAALLPELKKWLP